MHRSLAITLALLAVTARAHAQEPIKEQSVLDERLTALRRSLAGKHFELAKKLEKKHPAEARDELLLALTLQDDHKGAREKLGYAKDGDRWVGAPPPLPTGEPLDDKSSLGKERARDRKDAAQKLRTLAARAKLGGLVAPARDIAGLALEEDPEDKTARELIGHVKDKSAWTSERERKVIAAFAKVLASAPTGFERKDPDDEALAKLIDLGPLARRETPHAVVLATATAPQVDLAAVLKILETTWEAHRYYLAGELTSYSLEGEPARSASGAKPAPSVVPRWLFVGPDPEHPKFVERVVSDKKLHDFAKKLAGYSVRVALDAKRAVIVMESRFSPALRSEYAASCMADFLTVAPLGKGVKVPPFVLEGIKRFFGGHASGRSDVFYSSAGSSTGKRAFSGGSLDDLRAQVRPSMQDLLPENELRTLLGKGQNELERPDSARALAFVDFLLHEHRGELVAFISSLKAEEPPLATLETAMKKSIDDVEREWRAWVRREY